MPEIKAMTLAELIQAHQDRTGESFSQIAHRGGLSKAKIGQIALGQRHMPRLDTLERLGVALQQPYDVIQRAALATAGLIPEGSGGVTETDLMAGRISQLPEAERNVVSQLVDILLEQASKNDAKA